MFKPKEVSESKFLNNTSLHRLSETCNGVPKITSTPLNSHGPPSRRSKILLSPAVAKQGKPRRYSLSESSPSTSRTSVNVNEASPGPLLASLSFKDNVSMYEETKSSGLARRIVLYNEEAEQKRQPTHQEKYSSPGLFPIVHLFKKSPPLLEQSTKRVKIKLSSPESLRNYSPQHRNNLLEEMNAKPKLHRQHSLPSHSQANETSTKNVLDALKEISRKRMHSSEEQDHTEECGKRLRTELHNGPSTSSKRTRADSPLLESSKSPTSIQAQKKFCVYDEFVASKSSSDFSFLTKLEPARSKRKTTSTSTESPTEVKLVKLVNAETQTLNTSNENKTKTGVLDETDNEDTKKQERRLKVFDDAPLDRIRKSRLAALMGNLVGKDAALQLTSITKPELHNKPKEPEAVEVPKDQYVNENFINSQAEAEKKPTESDESQNKPLISILSPPRSTKESSPIKSDKHVQFNVTIASPFSQPSLTQMSSSIITPIVSDGVSKSPESGKFTDSCFSVDSSIKPSARSVPTSNVVPAFSFGNPTFSKSDIPFGNIPVTTVGSSTDPSSIINSVQSDKSSEIFANPTPNPSQPQKLGGFKFDLKLPSSSTSSSTTSSTAIPSISDKSLTTNRIGSAALAAPSNSSSSTTFAFGNPSEIRKETSNIPVSNISDTSLISNRASSEITTSPSTSSSTNTFTFATPSQTTISKKDSQFSFGKNMAAVETGSTPEPLFGFGGMTKSPSFNFGPTNTASADSKSQASTGGGFSFVSAGSKPSFGNPRTLNQATTGPTFGTVSTTNTGASFSVTTTPSGFGSGIPTFGAPATTTSSNFGDGQNVGKPAPTFPFGGGTTVTTSSVFGAKTDSIFGENTTSSITPGFGHATAGKTENPSFGNNTATNLTLPSASTMSTTVFGNASMPTFGNAQITKPSVFGNTPTATTTASSVFGGNSAGFATTNATNIPTFKPSSATSASGFGSNQPTFSPNPTTTASIFGATDTKPPSFASSNVFGASTSATTFGTNASSGFGAAAPPPAFGADKTTSNPPPYTASGFGTSNPTPTFSFGSNKPTTANPASASTFGTSSAFSAPGGFNPPNSGFGTGGTPFGNANATNTFGVTSAPTFGQTDNKLSFSFGATEPKSGTTFGQTENKPSFSFGSTEAKTNSGFGSGPGNSAFGKPTNTQAGFGTTSVGFGSSTTGFSTQQTNGGYNFGPNGSSTAAPFGFGAGSNKAEPPKPTFNFPGASMPAPSFGANNAPTFGAATPGFGVSTPAFSAAAPPAAGVFNIGAGSGSTGRPRTQLRAKRRT